MTSFPDNSYEKEALEIGFDYPVGVDEVGRGCVSGSVVAAAVHMPESKVEPFLGKVKDSKKISENKRRVLATEICTECDVGVGIIDNNIIDEINILQATKLAMRKALYELSIPYDYAFIDGNFSLDKLDVVQMPVVKGDSKVISIAAASIVAKVVRDNIMYELDKLFPLYSWKSNKGYLTKEHKNAIMTYGPCEYHRKSFKGIREFE